MGRDGTAHVYSVTCEWSQRSLSPNGVITAAFTCDPSKASALAEATAEELTSLGEETGKPPNADEVNAVVQVARERHRQAMRDNSSWLFWLLDTYKHHAMEGARRSWSRSSCHHRRNSRVPQRNGLKTEL